jgi:hypothetical protein
MTELRYNAHETERMRELHGPCIQTFGLCDRIAETIVVADRQAQPGAEASALQEADVRESCPAPVNLPRGRGLESGRLH